MRWETNKSAGTNRACSNLLGLHLAHLREGRTGTRSRRLSSGGKVQPADKVSGETPPQLGVSKRG